MGKEGSMLNTRGRRSQSEAALRPQGTDAGFGHPRKAGLNRKSEKQSERDDNIDKWTRNRNHQLNDRRSRKLRHAGQAADGEQGDVQGGMR